MTSALTSPLDLTPFSRTVVVATGKGGVGKTTISTHVAAILAMSKWRVLLIDFDPQGNCGRDLGYNELGLSDEGAGLLNAVTTSTPPLILRDVRPGLDVIPGGRKLRTLADVVNSTRNRGRNGRRDAVGMMVRALAPYVGDYDLVVIDTPPGEELLREIALTMARYVLIPTKSDKGSTEDGIRDLNETVADVLDLNPLLTPLGIVLYGVGKTHTAVISSARKTIHDLVGNAIPIFRTDVRHVEKVAQAIRDHGQLAHEIEAVDLTVPRSQRIAASSSGLAGDLQDVANEVVERITEHERVTA